ncbi:hypothetical protein [Actinomyces urogenitalis]|uniref:hypothetical protein n=1 Tax=Actinomyces urogenitalis TaxID=103621 RepID=UPI0028FFA28C|nr:hypothetical protein [Actinomyces urogenitalis]MDU0864439.1 hypothetical protein [Actinomyces urogenitalis]MDU0874985.1 hypothetical protein [Actinomyces urogenitalis]MDU1565344.1 hypothetical protein [Actinomyces urogenitalis]MDU1640587.1 hypothetical protein [Actinomyces urogenitalis]MDU6777761.1 hypothetical protein [Actinomyces urogenitalis]
MTWNWNEALSSVGVIMIMLGIVGIGTIVPTALSAWGARRVVAIAAASLCVLAVGAFIVGGAS